jgi:hypothetical protein
VVEIQSPLPPFHFFKTGIRPGLTFRKIDSFRKPEQLDFIYCGSVFTHIIHYRKEWLLELHRNLKKTGYLYITLQDHLSIAVAKTWPWDPTVIDPQELEEKGIVVKTRQLKDNDWRYSYVFYSQRHAKEVFGQYFNILGYYENAYCDSQSAMLLSKK